ncbi:hypothetical protein D3C81_842820 [compost metagenome]
MVGLAPEGAPATAYRPDARFQNSDNNGGMRPANPSNAPRARVRCISSLENTLLIASKL